MAIVSFPGDEWNPELEKLLVEYRVGGVIHFAENIPASGGALKELNRRIAGRGGEPVFISVDEEGGRVSRLASLIGEHPPAGELPLQKIYENYRSMGEKIRELGFNTDWAPVLDINSNPENPVIGNRAFGDTGESVMAGGYEAIRGLRDAGLLTCGKHFPGHGDTFLDSHETLPLQDTSLDVLQSRELAPFRMAVEECVDFIMTAHILFRQVDAENPATLSRKILVEILRGELGYEGIIVTDDLNMGALKKNYSLEERIEWAVNGGADVLLIRDDFGGIVTFLEMFRGLASAGKISEERLAESGARIKRLKERL
jgi:beta-N-acetylhexosaminidase